MADKLTILRSFGNQPRSRRLPQCANTTYRRRSFPCMPGPRRRDENCAPGMRASVDPQDLSPKLPLGRPKRQLPPSPLRTVLNQADAPPPPTRTSLADELQSAVAAQSNLFDTDEAMSWARYFGQDRFLNNTVTFLIESLELDVDPPDYPNHSFDPILQEARSETPTDHSSEASRRAWANFYDGSIIPTEFEGYDGFRQSATPTVEPLKTKLSLAEVVVLRRTYARLLQDLEGRSDEAILDFLGKLRKKFARGTPAASQPIQTKNFASAGM